MMKNGIFKDSQIVIANQKENEKNFWLNQLSGNLVKSFFPYDLDNWESRSIERSPAVLPFEWTGALFEGLSTQSGGSHYKLHIILLAAITLLLDKYTGNSDIIVSTPIYRPDLQGKFVNVILPLRIRPAAQHTFKELLKQVSQTLVQASDNQNYPMEILMKQIGMPVIEGEPSPLDTALVIENIHDPTHIRSINPGVIFYFLVTGGSIKGKVEYPANLYERATVERIILHLKRLLAKAVENLDCPLSRLELLSEEEKKQLLNDFNHQRLSPDTLPAADCLPGQRVYIVDGYHHLQPPELEGEVCIGQRMVETGDIARWLPDGTFEFSGRKENRFIFRGYRVQPEKIERYLLKLPHINEALVTVITDENHQDTLCAYFVSPGDLSPSQLKEQLKGKLPNYLIPDTFVRLDRMPLTTEGKIDRNRHKLQELEAEIKASSAVPGNITEEKLTGIWSEVFEVERETLRTDADFSQLGGQSLKAIMMSSMIHKEFNISIPIPTIFELSTIRGMAQYVKEAVKTEYCPINPAEKREYYDLSPGQKRLYLVQQMELESIGYNVPQIVRLEGVIHREQLENAFIRLIHTHESLRTSFRLVEDKPVQRIHHALEFAIQYHELRKEANNREGRKARDIAQDFVRPFDLSQAPLLRVGLVKENNNQHILMVDRHHIISDATSRAIFLRDFILLYDGKQLLSLKLQYKDYSQWQNSDKQKKALKQQENYWLKQFSDEGEIPVLNLPLDYSRPVVQSFAGNIMEFSLDQEETQKLQKLAAGEGATLFMTLLAVYNLFLAKICGQEDIIVGTPVLGRRHEDLENIMGIFVNTLALRNFPVSSGSFKEFLKDVKTRALTAFENQLYPFEDLVDRVSVNRDISRNPLFDTMFILDDVGGPDPDMENRDLKVLPFGYQYTTSNFDLALNASPGDNKLQFSFEYATKLFKESTIKRFAGFFKKIISEILEDNEKKLSEIEIISAEEKQQLLVDFNQTDNGYPCDKTLHRLFTEQAKKTPDSIAVIGQSVGRSAQSPGHKEKRHTQCAGRCAITYRELNEKSNHLAYLLHEKGVQPDTIVGIMVERSVEMIIGIFAVLKAGTAYLPIDPDYPQERINYMLTDSKVNILVKESNNISDFGIEQDLFVLNFEHLNFEFVSNFDIRISDLNASNLAYVIYTSGTTGKPKGVLIQHFHVVAYLNAFAGEFQLTPEDIVIQQASYSFDVFVEEVYPALFNGGKLVIAQKHEILDIHLLTKILLRHQVTMISCSPLMLNELNQLAGIKSIRIYISGGDVLKGEYINNLVKIAEVYNTYGPSETTVCATYHRCPQVIEPNIPIGKPIAYYRLYILDPNDKLLPVGIPGELYISGPGVARGYLNQPQLTAEKFCLRRPGGRRLAHSALRTANTWTPRKNFLSIPSNTHPLAHSPYSPYSPIYRTGDRARWLADGSIEFLGRIDLQVKIRGYRIELGEIENRLLKHQAIKEAVITANQRQGEEAEDKYLCAFFVSTFEKTPNARELKEYLSAELPEYMIPSYFVPLEKIPLTASGKVNKKALPEPRLTAKDNYIAPRNQLEESLRGIWADVLGIETGMISMDADFFELGGHSLNANMMASKIHKILEVKLPLIQVFKNRTIRGLANYIEKSAKERYLSIEPVEEKEYYELSSAQKRLYFLRELDVGSISYNIPLIVPLGRDVDIHKLESVLKKLIARHESLRTSFQPVKGAAVQRIHHPGEIEFALEYYQVDVKVEAEEIVTGFVRPFDLSEAPLMRSGIIKYADGSHTWMVDVHHIISDGTSHAILSRDFMSLYHGEELEPLRLQYRDFSRWQHQLFTNGAIKAQEEYWLRLYTDIEEIPRLHLPTDYKRPEVFNFAGDHYSFVLKREEAEKFKELGTRNGGTLYMNILAALNTLFYKYTGQGNMIIGTIIAGRPHADLQHIIGMFVNTLPMRNYPEGEKTYQFFLKEVIANSIQAFANQEVQFEELVEKLKPPRDLSRNPLFDVTIVVQNIEGKPGGAAPGPKLPLVPADEKAASPGIDSANNTSKFDMTFFVVERGQEIDINIQYYTGIFKTETIQRLAMHFKNLVKAVINQPFIRLKDIEIMSEQERELVLYEFNDTAGDYPKDKKLHQWFEEQVERTPDHIALLGIHQLHQKGTGWGAPLYITYRELNEKSHQLACILQVKGVQTDTIVGIMVERSLEMVIGIFAILKAGGAYLPIDPEYPEERIQYILTDSTSKFLVTTPGLSEKFEKLSIVNCQLLMVNEKSSNCRRLNNPPKEANSINNYQLTINNLQLKQANLAYVIYTSGSTGTPKGVLIEHPSVANILKALQEKYPFSPADTYLLKTSFLFDVSVTELFGWFIGGGRLAVLEKGNEKNPPAILDTIEKAGVSHINFVPSMFQILLETLDSSNIKKLAPLKYIFLAGEAFLPGLVEKFNLLNTGIILENIYGPTEGTVYASQYPLSEWRTGSIPIGKPLQNIQLYILDRYDRTQPLGVPGELCIAGAGLARGYLSRPELTAEKFLTRFNRFYMSHMSYISPKLKETGKKNENNQKLLQGVQGDGFLEKSPPGRRRQNIYRTGDLARWLPDGNIDFLGRMDHQVKIRGFRVELGEIESRLLKLQEIKETVVLSKKLADADASSLFAYFVSDQELSVTQLREYLSQQLPGYMIPSHFVKVEKIPLTPTGKIDRKALEALGQRLLPRTAYIPPESEIEKKIADTWKEILRLDKVGIHDNYFDLGGTSFDIIRINMKLREVFQVNIPLVTMFRYTTVYLLAKYLEGEGEEEPEIRGREEKFKKGKESKMQRRQKRKGARTQQEVKQ